MSEQASNIKFPYEKTFAKVDNDECGDAVLTLENKKLPLVIFCSLRLFFFC